MKIFYALTLFVLITSSQLFSQTINSEFKTSENISKLKEGDLVEATMRFWPIENADLEQFRKLDKTLLFNSLYLAQITQLGISANNADVVELSGIFVVKTAKPQPVFNFKYNNSTIDINLGAVTIEQLKDNSQDFYILDQSLNISRLWMILVGVAVLLLIVSFYKRKSIKDFIIGLRPDKVKKARKQYDSLFRKADKREDFEAIYSSKNVWMTLLENKAPAHLEFLKTLNQYQYKKDWSNEDYQEVRAAFDVIRRSFE